MSNLQLRYNAFMTKLRTLKDWSAAVKARDGKCMVCGATTALVAHHIKPKSKYPELKFDVDNGQTMCVDCHKDHHKANPVRGIGEGVVSKVWMKKRIKELERELEWLTDIKTKALSIIGGTFKESDRVVALRDENMRLKAENAVLRTEALRLKSLLAKKKVQVVPV